MPINLIVLSSPSGGGKTTVARHLVGKFDKLKFAVSATTRAPRKGEIEGKDYFYLTKDEFQKKIENGEFIEHEEIFGNYYGTLKSELEKATNENRVLVFDIDVKGAISIKKLFPEQTLLIFITPPDLKTLEERLRNRNSETEEQLKIRLSRAEMEISLKEKFDKVIINDEIENAFSQAEVTINNIL